MFDFNSKSGYFYGPGVTVWGYSGHGLGRNNPDMEKDQGIGPIPRGDYTIGHWYDDQHLGPVVMHLDPKSGTDTFGRSLFRIHGNNAANDASHGCIILDHATRLIVAHSGITDLRVY